MMTNLFNNTIQIENFSKSSKQSTKILISTLGYELEIDSWKKEVAERELDYLKQ